MRSAAAPVGGVTSALPRAWFERDTVSVARELIGCALVVDGEVTARIVETEAYLGTRDPASHAFRGPTPRAGVMFRRPGHLYVYLSYGVHHCANIVTEPDGVAGAVLLRAAAVEGGGEAVLRRRGVHHDDSALLRGPGNLCRGLGLSLLDNGMDICDAQQRLRVVRGSDVPPIVVAPRVGISVARHEPLRFAWAGHPAVSTPLPWKKRKPLPARKS
jgi:DNA-3-methyladenine glycosylase